MRMIDGPINLCAAVPEPAHGLREAREKADSEVYFRG